MKDFLLLVKAVKASSFTSVRKKNNGKVVKPHTVTLALVISSLLLNFAFGFQYLSSIMQLKEYGLTFSEVSPFIRNSLTAYILLGFFLSLVYSVSIFFRGNNNVFLSLPISGNKYFLAKLVLSLTLNFTYGGLTLLIIGLITTICFSLSLLSYLYVVLIFLCYVIASPCLSFIVVSLLGRFIRFESNVATTIFTIICSIFAFLSLVIVNISSNFTICDTVEGVKEYLLNADFVYINWIGFIPYKLIALSSTFDNIYVVALLGITIVITIFSLLISKRSYLKLLGSNNGSTSTKKVKKIYTDKEYTLLNKPKKLLLKREFANYKKDITILIRSFFTPIIMGIALSIALYSFRTIETEMDTDLLFLMLAIILLCFCASYYIMPYTSISIEQKNFVMLKTLPLKLDELIKIKLLPSLMIFVPLNVIIGVVFLFSASVITVSYIVSMILISILFPVCNILFDFLMGILFADFNYDNAATLLTKGWGVAFCNIFQYGMVGIIALVYALPVIFAKSLIIGTIVSSLMLLGTTIALYFVVQACLDKLIKRDINY